MTWQDQKPSWQVFNQVGAEDRIKIYEEVQKIVDESDNSIQLTDWQMWVLKQVYWGGHRYCEYSEENHPELLMFEIDDEDCVELDALKLLDVEYSASAYVIVEVKQERRCANCGIKESWLAWKEDKGCSRWVDGEEIFFDDHDWIDFDQRVKMELTQ